MLHQPPHIGLLRDVSLGICFKSTEWVWEHFVSALSGQWDNINVGWFSASKAPFLFHPESVYLELRTSLLKIWEMGWWPHITRWGSALGKENNWAKHILSIELGYSATSTINSICCLSDGNCIHQRLLYMSKNNSMPGLMAGYVSPAPKPPSAGKE